MRASGLRYVVLVDFFPEGGLVKNNLVRLELVSPLRHGRAALMVCARSMLHGYRGQAA
jgi:hypothetical protein